MRYNRCEHDFGIDETGSNSVCDIANDAAVVVKLEDITITIVWNARRRF